MSAVDLSVVIPSVNGWDDLDACLAALVAQRGVSLELLVPERCGAAVRERAATKYPSAVLLPVSVETTIPEMRALAFDRATAPSVAVIEDHVIVPEGWAAAMIEARTSAQVVGGGVHNTATGTLVDWAAYLCEYSHMLPPLPVGESSWITGNNTVYARDLLERHRAATHAGRWEGYLHDTLRAEGIPLIFRPDILVGHQKHYSFGEYFSQRYYYARSYAGARAVEGGWGRRIAYGCIAFALPPVLLWRTVSRCLRKEVDRGLVWRSLPLTVLFVCAWSAGDIVGAWFGAGDSLSKVC
ncbi:MAG: hypothetical protein V4503_10040 [Gemmatimonadota bacterium]